MADKAPKASEAPKTTEQIIEELKAQLAAQNEIIEGQSEQLQAAEAGAAEGRPVVTHDKQLYRVVAKQFDIDGTTIKASELKDKPELIEKLVDAKSGVLVAVSKEEAAKA